MTTKNYWPIKSVWFASLFLAMGLLCYDASAVESFKETKVKAEQGDTAAQFNLGNSYYKGEGVQKDYAEAVKWYRKAADQNHADAQFNLGLKYFNGQGVDKDYAETVKWYRKAAHQNHEFGQLGLGQMYEIGNGIEKDYVEAYAWYNISAKNNSKFAKFRDDLENKMSPQQIADAQKRTKQLRALIDANIKNAK